MKIPKAESLIFMAFLGCLALLAVSKCSSKRSELVRQVRELDPDDGVEDRPIRRDTVVAQTPQVQMPKPVVQAPPPTPTQYNTALREPGEKAQQKPATETLSKPAAKAAEKPAAKSAAKPSTPAAAAKANTTLFVTIEGLKVRKEPGLKGETIEELPLYAPVEFLNQKTEWTQEISLGYEKVTDHWVKIKTEAGKTGWVFGAGLHYYKMKRTGVIPETKATEPAAKKKN